MIENNDIICFCNDWDGDPLSKKQIVRRLARRNRVLWVNSTGCRNPTLSAHDLRRVVRKVAEFCSGCRQVAPNISLFTPLVIPFHSSALAKRINPSFFSWSLRRTCRKLGFHRPLTLTFVPTSSDVVGTLDERRVIYYCVDDYSQFTGADPAVAVMERELIRKADLVVVSAAKLLEAKRRLNANTQLVTHGVDVEHFRAACESETLVPADCADVSSPTIGFFGLIEDWVDLGIIRYLASRRPDWTFVLVGQVRTDVSSISSLPNVRLLGRRPYETLPGYCKAFDVAILPFVVNQLTLAANPLKLREYLAAGLPVVATPLPEVVRLSPLLRTARDGEEFLRQITDLLAAGRRGPSLELSKRLDSESWDDKVEELSTLIMDLEKGRAVAASSSQESRVA